jgi:NAD+ diphosphatase
VTNQIHPIRPNVFAASPLDRVDAQRKNQAWIAEQIAAPTTTFLPVWRARSLISVAQGTPPRLAELPASAMRAHLENHPWALLGTLSNRTLFAIDLSSLDSPLPETADARFEDLRRVGTLLPAGDAAILAHARGLMHWRTRHRFCGVCGAACLARDAGHVLACTGCGAHHFPRTDPAVIMLVTDGDRVLLGQPARFRDMRVFTTLAGFVEPGESLEEAVAREVYEEAGIRVARVRYHSSQPWPFPCSIMLGFTAEAADSTINIDTDELVAADWFTRDQLRNPEGFVLPPAMSIARRLIDDWISA